MGYKRPQQSDLLTDASFSDFVTPQQTYLDGPPRTTAAISGMTSYGVTTFNMADILQGTFAVKDQSDQLLVINKALTGNLQGMYQTGIDGVSAFGNSPLRLGGTSSGGTAYGQPVKESWVDSLPTVHPDTNALIWISKGKLSAEMHLPVADNIQDDIRNHIQLDSLPPEERHPYYMDRLVGDQVGGRAPSVGSDGYVVDWGGGDSIIGTHRDPNKPDTDTMGGEDPNKPGASGAFGLISPEEEQWYCAMAWPLNYNKNKERFRSIGQASVADWAEQYDLKHEAYRGKKALIFNVKTKVACVCSPGEWGPLPTRTMATNGDTIAGFIAGASPDTLHAIGAVRGDEIKIKWVDDSIPLGPYQPTEDQLDTTVVSSTGSQIETSSGGNSTSSPQVISDLKHASRMILNHPNCWMKKQGARVPGQPSYYATAFVKHMTDGVPHLSSKATFTEEETGRQWLYPSLLNYLWYILEGGYILDYYVGSIGERNIANGSRLSYHTYGGAIDIGAIGIASEGIVYSISDSGNWRRVCDSLFNFLSTLPQSSRPDEVGSSFSYNYPNNFRVFKDANPTHIHLGFAQGRTGTLISRLKQSGSGSQIY